MNARKLSAGRLPDTNHFSFIRSFGLFTHIHWSMAFIFTCFSEQKFGKHSFIKILMQTGRLKCGKNNFGFYTYICSLLTPLCVSACCQMNLHDFIRLCWFLYETEARKKVTDEIKKIKIKSSTRIHFSWIDFWECAAAPGVIIRRERERSICVCAWVYSSIGM